MTKDDWINYAEGDDPPSSVRQVSLSLDWQGYGDSAPPPPAQLSTKDSAYNGLSFSSLTPTASNAGTSSSAGGEG